MRTFFCSALALSLALALHPAAAQAPDDMLARMEAAQAEAQAQAVRPGDEELSCDALQAEMVATMQDPAVQTQMAQQGAWAQGQMDAADGARGQMMAMMGMSMFMGLASSFVPGLGYLQGAQQRAMSAGMEAQAQQNMAQSMQQAEGAMTIMPQLMRGQRLYELGQAKQCAFVQEQAPSQE